MKNTNSFFSPFLELFCVPYEMTTYNSRHPDERRWTTPWIWTDNRGVPFPTTKPSQIPTPAEVTFRQNAEDLAKVTSLLSEIGAQLRKMTGDSLTVSIKSFSEPLLQKVKEELTKAGWVVSVEGDVAPHLKVSKPS